ncbi:MAG: ATPase [Thermoleophilia bacterium]|nr:ATPase [Thermoleophilia bacterium]
MLLNAFEARAEAANWVTVATEIHKHGEFAEKLANLARRALFTLSPRARWGVRASAAAQVLKSFSITVGADGVSAGLDAEKLEGRADSGMLADDMTDLFVALGEAAREQGRGVVFLIDELQYLSAEELGSFIAALHRTIQRSLPITLVGAGLPQLPKLAGDARSYAERLFKFPRIGALSEPDAQAALVGPAGTEGVTYEQAALDAILQYTEGYPYFLQEYGKATWHLAEASPITADDVRAALPQVEAELDESFFRVRADRTTAHELRYLRAMATLGPLPQAAKDVAAVLGRTSEQLGPVRARLIEKGLLFTPSHGHAEFTVPQFDRYMLRAYADLLND